MGGGKCPSCGAPLPVAAPGAVSRCEYCGVEARTQDLLGRPRLERFREETWHDDESDAARSSRRRRTAAVIVASIVGPIVLAVCVGAILERCVLAAPPSTDSVPSDRR